METEVSLPCPQEPATVPYPQPAAAIPHSLPDRKQRSVDHSY